jgi:MFS transporter, DHA2 family, multidrug resistance protein
VSDQPSINPDEPLWRQPHNPWLIAVVVALAAFMEVLDTSVANVALPYIAGGLAASQDESTWVLTSYLVSNAVILPLSGWISERIGRKRFYMSCVVVFTLSSLLCGIAPNLGALVFFRVLQGAGGGGLQPSVQAIVADTFPPAKRGMAFAVYGMAVVAAPALGPTLGGWITDNFTWRWIFFINVPVGIVSLILTARLIEDPPYLAQRRRPDAKVDYLGFGLMALGLGTLQIVLDKGQRDDWFAATYIRVFTFTFIVALTLFVIRELRTDHPIVDLRLFKDRTFVAGNIMLFMLGFVLYSTTVLIPQFAQELMGYTAQLAGMVISPGGITILLLMPVAGFLVTHYDPRRVIAFGFLVTGLATLHMLEFNLDIDFRTMMWARVFQSAGIAFLFVPINTTAFAQLPREKGTAAAGLINLSRNIGGSVGISFVTTMLARRVQFHQSVLVAHLNEYNGRFLASVQTLEGALTAGGVGAVTSTSKAYGVLGQEMSRQASMLSYRDNFFVLGLSALALVPLAFLMKRPRGGGPVSVE